MGLGITWRSYNFKFCRAGRGLKIENGMVLAIEPMVNVGTYKVGIMPDGWTAVTLDGKRSAHFEHSIAIIDGKAVVLKWAWLKKY